VAVTLARKIMAVRVIECRRCAFIMCYS